jgi:hypothetical protein
MKKSYTITWHQGSEGQGGAIGIWTSVKSKVVQLEF